ncbi:V-type proton ATPase 16 kDa proteolipid subunit, putative [Plasmodium chabaudi chabaudi]|uniref:V-type proton ATPase proteolipid subunit n=3 Tax=Plasmodium (Vinckeia) TaxID=418101 RepID=A0A077TN76_PLACU|nr:V-type proton ATPase 16 kDa proteolipid subunit, putative [Plasmodium chabaudi chabaudi]CAD2099035.1 V-type proton ATPase 16 kDa proteolipid subunit, putative [Plasmodium vinckei brucechwatti]SCM23279.1 V-type proton ATPase 16 kDa proteolipid subunit, putative [Plasmodium chabaudi adami]SCM25226.1 V-type proton ATPase 16 kDa proteolipid subunit, putative [Plasmodium chabaudi chabaudi]SCN62343.1 V-type proton ATPase 16 kDa proteolipid subunit, putative [Plasmodium chabaudi adami]SCN62344.1 V|eukprot:XP_016654325.1 V-type proton ATPase 16 kDa proteolipid subunit, putative [Plasmodium chabaudi chabaudi]
MRTCDPNSAFFGFMGIAASSIFSNLGAAFGTAKSGVGVCSVGVMRPDLIMKSILPVVMAGVLGIYGIIMSIIISGKMSPAASYSSYLGYTHLASGLIVGLSSLAAGLAIGIVGDAGVRANAQQNRLFIGMILILVFSETLALYGLIIGIYISLSDASNLCTPYNVA